jgi:hypothetical protein
MARAAMRSFPSYNATVREGMTAKRHKEKKMRDGNVRKRMAWNRGRTTRERIKRAAILVREVGRESLRLYKQWLGTTVNSCSLSLIFPADALAKIAKDRNCPKRSHRACTCSYSRTIGLWLSCTLFMLESPRISVLGLRVTSENASEIKGRRK